MYDKIYVINPYNYPEDWALVCGKTDLEAISLFCKDNNLDITIDQFYEKYEIDMINSIGGRRIKSIELE